MAFYRFNEMDVQGACPGFMILEEDITEGDEEIVRVRYLTILFIL